MAVATDWLKKINDWLSGVNTLVNEMGDWKTQLNPNHKTKSGGALSENGFDDMSGGTLPSNCFKGYSMNIIQYLQFFFF